MMEWLMLLFVLIGALVSYATIRCLDGPSPKAIVDGRTHDEWYELLKAMGKETVDFLSLPPLDGSDRSKEYGWNYKKLLGPRWDDLANEWSPTPIAPSIMPAKLSRNEIIEVQKWAGIVQDGIMGPRTKNAISFYPNISNVRHILEPPHR